MMPSNQTQITTTVEGLKAEIERLKKMVKLNEDIAETIERVANKQVNMVVELSDILVMFCEGMTNERAKRFGKYCNDYCTALQEEAAFKAAAMEMQTEGIEKQLKMFEQVLEQNTSLVVDPNRVRSVQV